MPAGPLGAAIDGKQHHLNDPFVRREALALAERVLKAGTDEADRVDLAYRLTVGRPATAKEIERVRDYVSDYESATRLESGAKDDPKTAAWASFCQALLGSAEFRCIR